MWFFILYFMNTFDSLFFSIYNYYKQRKKKMANRIALFYITIVQGVLILLLGIFFSEFFKNMNVATISADKAWIFFVLIIMVLAFKNWIQYSGRKRKVLRARHSSSKSKDHNIVVLWLVPIFGLLLSIILLKVLH